MKKGIDVSTFQGELNEEKWREIKNSGIEFAILRIGYTGYGKEKSKQIDDQFENNYKMCKKIGLPVGGYWYSCATSEEEAIEEAQYTLKYLEGKKLEYPVYIDTEDNHDINKYSEESQYSIGKERLTEIILRQIPLENNINRETQKDLVRVLLWEEIAERRERKRRDGKTPLENL